MNNKDLKHDIMNAIKDGDVQMHSKKFFLGKALLSIVGITFVTLAILFLGSFIIFITRESSAWELTQFGTAGIASFITSLPWLILSVGLLLIGMLAKLIQTYRFAYHKPIIASIAVIIAVSVGGGYAVAQTSLHKKINNHVETGKLKAAAPLYKRAQQHKPKHLTVGIITDVHDKGFMMKTRRQQDVNVIISDNTRKPPHYEPHITDKISVFGKNTNNTIHARGIKPITKKHHLKKIKNHVEASDQKEYIRPTPEDIRKKRHRLRQAR